MTTIKSKNLTKCSYRTSIDKNAKMCAPDKDFNRRKRD